MSETSDTRGQRLSRRRALKVLAGSAGAAAFPILNNPRAVLAMQGGAPRPGQAGKFLNAQQVRTLDAIAETIIPADEHSPGAHAAGVWAYIDAIVADSDENQKSVWKDGLVALDRLADEGWGKEYAECSPEQQAALLQKLSRNEDLPQTPEERFFVAVKRATIEGYYTSEIGIHQELEYKGNAALADFPGCPHEAHGKGGEL